MPAASPTDIKADRAAQTLRITWSDGRVDAHDFVTLRGQCACAGCIDEWTGKPLLDPATIPVDLTITSITPVGNYAITIAWSDGHDTGIYTWKRLRELADSGH